MKTNPIFVDTSAIYACLIRGDRQHPAATAAIELLSTQGAELVTSSFVVQESVSLLQAMRAERIHRAFAFDPHFGEQGFELVSV